jgi:hypothetical protein
VVAIVELGGLHHRYERRAGRETAALLSLRTAGVTRLGSSPAEQCICVGSLRLGTRSLPYQAVPRVTFEKLTDFSIGWIFR